MEKRRLLFLIRSLGRGGAERQLIELVAGLAKTGRYDITVCTFYSGGALREEMARLAGVSLVSLGKQGRWDVLPFFRRLLATVRAARPHIIHGYMGVANAVASAAAQLVGSRCIWGLRASNVDLSHYDRLSSYEFRFGAICSKLPDAIIVNSEAGRRHYVLHGYSSAAMHVIPNGIDCERFRPDPQGGARTRAEWGVPHGERLVGLIARLDPMKDHETFLQAAAQVRQQSKSVRFVCVGGGAPARVVSLKARAAALGLSEQVIWAGDRGDVPAIYSALDLVVSSSAFGEGFPNVVAEGMACERLVVTTSVGDAANVVGEQGGVVPPRDPAALADAIGRGLALRPDQAVARGAAARQRVISNFSVGALVASTEAVFANVLGDRS